MKFVSHFNLSINPHIPVLFLSILSKQNKQKRVSVLPFVSVSTVVLKVLWLSTISPIVLYTHLQVNNTSTFYDFNMVNQYQQVFGACIFAACCRLFKFLRPFKCSHFYNFYVGQILIVSSLVNRSKKRIHKVSYSFLDKR